jgi:hypothetical protein
LRLSRVAAWIRRLLGPALLATVPVAAWKAYQLGFTNRYADDPFLGPRYRLAGEGWRGVAGSSLVASAQYLCPLLFLTFLLLLLRRWREPRIEAVALFISGFFLHFALLEWVLPYQPYYARYLASEFVPYIIVFVVCAWAFTAPGPLKATLRWVLLISGIYAAALSAAQIGKNENDKAYESIARVAAPVDDGDLLLIDTERIGGFAVSELKTPLVYTFGRQVVDVSRSSLADPAYLTSLRTSYGDVYLVSCAAVPPAGFTPVDALPFKVLAYRHGIQAPLETFWRIDTRLYLYKLERLEVPPGTRMEFGTRGGTWNDLLDANWSIPEPWGIWALGHSATLQFTLRAPGRAERVDWVRLWLKAFVSPRHPRQRVTVRLDGEKVRELLFQYPDTADIQSEIPLVMRPPAGSRPITIEFLMPDAVSPQSLGLSSDTRVIGVGIERLELLGGRSDEVDTQRPRP